MVKPSKETGAGNVEALTPSAANSPPLRPSDMNCSIRSLPILRAAGAHLVLLGTTCALAEPEAGKVDFSRDIRPVLSENCFRCHGPDEENRKAKLRLDLKESAFQERDGDPAFTAGNLEASETWYRITTDDSEEVMPPPKSRKVLTKQQKELFKKWIVQGAEWNSHWAFESPKKVALPSGRNPIDHFIAKGHAEHGLAFSPPADPRTLTRRLSLDLTGLPTTLEDLAKFKVDDPAFDPEAVIIQYLASPHFGERMALMWLDAARYGDTSVMHADGPRDMWAWRDWVVRAYNENKPFNEFGIEQLAGDLMPKATIDQRVASGFNRNHATSDEGGAIAEELRVDYVVDRVRTTANVFMGLTMECAQCHDHKYDPITQREYYRFFAYFNNHSDPGMQIRHGNQAPVVNVPSRGHAEKLAALRKDLEDRDKEIEKLKEAAKPQFVKWLHEAEKSAEGALPEPPGLAHFFPLDEMSGEKVQATVGGGIGKLSGKLHSAKRDSGTGLKFDGKTAFTLDSWPARERDTPFTFAAWLKAPGNGSGSVFARMDVGKAYRGYDLWLQNRAVGTHIINQWPGNALKVVSAQQLAENKWQHVAVVYDGSSKATGMKIYIDGKLVGNKVEQDSLKDSIATDTPFKIGSRSQGGNYNGELDELRIYDRALSEAEVQRLGGDPIKGILAISSADRSENQRTALLEHYLSAENKDYQQLVAARAELQRQETAIQNEKMTTSMVMQDNPPEKMRKTYILDRGAYDAPKKEEEILAGTPVILPTIDTDAPQNRLTLARWLFTDEHPLTARVAVNMIWQAFFGAGLVATPGDFGAQGSYPTHPELLDWLAVDFRENGWDVKRLIRQILTSQTYQQSSQIRPPQRRTDAPNHYLARASRYRLQAEFIRDNALSLAGLLNRQFGGPGVKPYQPPGLWAQVSLSAHQKFKRDNGEKLYRRSIYTYWKRSAPAPNMHIFDAPTREVCVMKRPRTNTPLQALVTLNDTQFVEAARMMAQGMMIEGGDTPDSHSAYGFELATARKPNDLERETMREVYQKALAKYLLAPDRAKELLKVGEAKRDESLPIAEHAAMTIVANLILNLDETLTRE